MEEAASRYWSSIHGIDIALGPVHTQGKLALRVHNRHKNKMPAINSAIAYLHQTGQIKQILDKYSDFSLWRTVFHRVSLNPSDTLILR